MRRTALALTIALFFLFFAIAQEKAASTNLPDGWNRRFDRAGVDVTKFEFFKAGDGLHATTGPAGIVWKDEHSNLKGNYRISATFLQTKAPAHPEAYGLIIGGKNLDKDNQEYGYFVIRGDGKYMVKHRAGAEVHTRVTRPVAALDADRLQHFDEKSPHAIHEGGIGPRC